MNKNRLLHVTNGDGCADSLKSSSLEGDVLPWRDVLHDGPVPGDLNLENLAEVRSKFIAEQSQSDYEETLRAFTLRDEHLAHVDQYDEVILWFEHDLYDQLQLLQILDRFAQKTPVHSNLNMICINNFPHVDPFYGLGQLSSQQLQSLYGSQKTLTMEHLDLGREGWKAFTSPDINTLLAYADRDLALLPYMKASLYRFFEEFPSTENGLSRTQQQILSMLEKGVNQPQKMFRANQKIEEATFMGDWGYFNLINELSTGDEPALITEELFPSGEAFLSQNLKLTSFGEALINNKADWVIQNGIDKWFGGVHLSKANVVWRWDSRRRRFTS